MASPSSQSYTTIDVILSMPPTMPSTSEHTCNNFICMLHTHSASPHTLTTLLYGLAALGYRPVPAFFTAFYRATSAAMTPSAPATRSGRGPASATRGTGKEAQSSKGSAPASVRNGTHSSSSSSSQPRDRRASAADSDRLTGRGLARTLWALATLRKDPPALWLARWVNDLE